jgi:hypothetical protein
MQTFRHQWQVYSKVVDNDYLSHQAVGAVLHRQLMAQVNWPFRFLDLACGRHPSDGRGTPRHARDPLPRHRPVDSAKASQVAGAITIIGAIVLTCIPELAPGRYRQNRPDAT